MTVTEIIPRKSKGMKKRTHLLVTRHIARNFGVSKFNKVWLYFGVVFPDLTPLCLLRPHMYSTRLNGIISQFNSLDLSIRDWKFYFKLGYVSHYLADFFTAPHNRVGIKGFCFNHRNYEDDLDLFFRDNLPSFNLYTHSNILSDNYFDNFPCDGLSLRTEYLSDYILDFYVYLTELHKRYLEQDSCLSTDFEYICIIVYKVLIFCCSVSNTDVGDQVW